jgi:voltage-gated potassium channel Kch
LTNDKGEAFQRFSRAVDGPLMVLALAMIPLIVVPLVADLSPGQARAVLALNLVAAALVLTFERDMPNGNIHSYPDALWWAVTTITTVGYGDRFPMSPAGRGVAVVLMVSGIALFGVITASIAAYFVEQKAEQDLAGRLDRVLERLDAIEAKLPSDEQEQQRLQESARAQG